jgi:hypothetical protein
LDIHVYWNILTMHGPINVKSPNNTSKWQMGFNSAFKGLIGCCLPFPKRTLHPVPIYAHPRRYSASGLYILRQVGKPECSMVERSLNKELEMMCQTVVMA